jgi:4-hydroxymandelate oxidase
VLIGRPFVWALAVGGQSGVESALQMLRNELDIAMALTGCACISDIERKLIWRNQEAGPPQQ